MLLRRAWLLAAAALAAACLAPEARATTFSYTTSVTPAVVTGSSGGLDSEIDHMNASGNNRLLPAGGTDITVGYLSIVDNSGGNYTDTYNAPISIKVTIDGVASTTFKGTLSGTVTSDGFGDYAATFANPGFDGPHSVVVGGLKFTITAILTKDFTAPGAPNFTGAAGAGLAGAYSFHITAAPVPEPSTLALAGIGSLGLIGLVRRRRARA
jgi:hypothetical protein